MAATATNLGRSPLPWVAVATGLFLIAVVITIAVNVPLNDAIKAAGDPDRIGDLARVRDEFNEGRWVAWNLVRTVMTMRRSACSGWALVLDGRATG